MNEFIVLVTTRTDDDGERIEQTFAYGPFDYEQAEGFVDVAREHDLVTSDADVRMVEMNDVQTFMMTHMVNTPQG